MIEEKLKPDEIKSRLRKIHTQNEVLYNMIKRTRKMIQRTRLERSLLLDKLDQVTRNPAVGDAMNSSPPGSPEPHLYDEPVDPATGLPNGGNKTSNALAGALTRASAIKKSPTAYKLFCEDFRDNVARKMEADGKEPKKTAVQSHLSDVWKGMSKEERKPYADKARVLKYGGHGGDDHPADQEDDSDPESMLAKDETEEPLDSMVGSDTAALDANSDESSDD